MAFLSKVARVAINFPLVKEIFWACDPLQGRVGTDACGANLPGFFRDAARVGLSQID